MSVAAPVPSLRSFFRTRHQAALRALIYPKVSLPMRGGISVTTERILRSGKCQKAMSFPDGGFDAVASGLVLNFVPHPENAIAEMRRTLRAGGTAAVYVWDYAGKMQSMRYFWIPQSPSIQTP